MTTAKEFGAGIGRELLADHDAKGAPRIAAADMVRALFEVNPRAKLPALLAKGRVRAWMADTGVTECMLREAMTAARKTVREEAKTPEIILPPKRRKTTKAPSAKSRPSTSSPSIALLPASSAAPQQQHSTGSLLDAMMSTLPNEDGHAGS